MSKEAFYDYHLNGDEHYELALELCRVQAQLAELRRLASDYGLLAQMHKNRHERNTYVDGIINGDCQKLTEYARLSSIDKSGYKGMIEQEEL